jgi:hypothetical protein
MFNANLSGRAGVHFLVERFEGFYYFVDYVVGGGSTCGHAYGLYVLEPGFF